MNKVEYLDALKEALKDTDKEIMEEILADYEEHFQVGLENGKTEEQICEDLGSIEDLVKEIKEVYTSQSTTEDEKETRKNKIFGEWNFSFDNINSENINKTINSALNTASEALKNIDVAELGRSVKKTVDQAASTLNSFADDYIKNQGNPFDSARRHAEGFKENVSKSFDDTEVEKEDKGEKHVSFNTEGETEFEKPKVNLDEKKEDTVPESTEEKEEDDSEAAKQIHLSIDGICADVNIKKSENGKLNISYENNGTERQKQMYEFYSYKEGNTVYAGIRKVGKAVFFFNFAVNSIVINVELPDYMGNVNVKTASGDIKVNQVQADRIVLSTASGDVLASEIRATDFKVKTSSGDAEVNDVNAIQLYVGTSSGDIKATDLEAKNMSIKSTSGDIETSSIKSEIIDLNTMSGDVNMLHTNAGENKVRSTSGDVCVNDMSMNHADISSTSGDLKITGVIGDGLRANSASGDVRTDINVKKCHASSKSGDVDVCCEGDIILEATSTSGDISVRLRNYGNGYTIKSRTTSGGLYINYGEEHHRNLKTGTYFFGKQSSELMLGSVSGDIHLND